MKEMEFMKFEQTFTYYLLTYLAKRFEIYLYMHNDDISW